MTVMLPVTGKKSALLTEIIDATERAEDLLTLWRERRRLAHRVRLAWLRAELTGLDPDEQDLLEDEVAEFKRLVHAFAEVRRAA